MVTNLHTFCLETQNRSKWDWNEMFQPDTFWDFKDSNGQKGIFSGLLLANPTFGFNAN